MGEGPFNSVPWGRRGPNEADRNGVVLFYLAGRYEVGNIGDFDTNRGNG